MRARRAFTLVELLVVIGIIALLISILLPALARAKEQSRMVKCLSNIRQIGMAFIMYTDANKGGFPAPAVKPLPDDWLYWNHPLPDTMEESVIYRYIDSSQTFNADFFMCPSDEPGSHKQHGFPYSYTVNEKICNYYNRINKVPIIRMSQIRNPTNKILIVDESAATVDDGCWAPQNYIATAANPLNLLSNKHDKKIENSSDPTAGRGNVGFCDGHAQFIERLDATLPEFWDPLLE